MAILRPPLLTERDELYGTGWRDCTQSAAMMVVWFGRQGPQLFPLGYTAQEREALERSDDKTPEEQGTNLLRDIPVAVKRRYNKVIHPQGGSLRAALAAAGTNKAFALSGNNGKWAAGDHYRRWDTAFSGNHAVAAIGMGDGKNLWWLDPEAPKGYPGEIISITKVMQWSFGDGWALYAMANEYAPVVVTPPPVVIVTPPAPVPTEDPMAFSQVEVPTNTWLYVNAAMDSNASNVQVSPGRPMLLLKANAAAGAHLIVHDTTFKHYYVRASEVKVTPLFTTAPVVTTPPVVIQPTAETCKVFSDAAYASGKAAGILEGGATGILKGTDAEQARIKTVLGLK